MTQGETKYINGQLYYWEEKDLRWYPVPLQVVGGGGGRRGARGPIGPAGTPGGFVPAVTDASLTGDGSAGDPLALPYKIYASKLSQSGTNAPVVTVLENTLGALVWTRLDVGQYQATLAGAFPDDAKWLNFLGIDLTGVFFGGGGIIDLSRINANTLQLNTYDSGFTLTDGLLAGLPLELRVYP